jgi:hypothetical protein
MRQCRARMAAMPQPESGETGAVWNFMRLFLYYLLWYLFYDISRREGLK